MPRPNAPTKTVPRRALCFAGDLTTENSTGPSAGESAGKQIPFSMLARSNGIANHPFWGRCVHDFAGMLPVKPSISVDYCHDPGDVIGYADRLEITANGLELAGALVSLTEGDRADEIHRKHQAKVPYEASILTNWETLEIEELPEGYALEVNGQTVEGPATIFRQWEIWGVAICPYGSDPNTALAFSAGNPPAEFSITERPSTMTTPTPAPAPVVTAPAKSGADYMARFGEDRGAKWFAKGVKWEDAVEKFEGEMTDELAEKDKTIAELQSQLAALQTKYNDMQKEMETTAAENSAFKRGAFPVPGTPPAGTPAAPTKQGGIDRFAAGLKLPGQPARN